MEKKEQNGVQPSFHGRFAPTPPMLVGEISRLFRGRMREFDLTGVMSQDSARLIMRALAKEDGVSQLHLCAQTHLKAPTVSITLRRMEEEGLVQRRQDLMDQRVTNVYLTESGKAHNRRVWERLTDLENTMMQGFSEEEVALLGRLLERMRDNILPAREEKHTDL